MELIRTLAEAAKHDRARGGVVAIGNFDGVHRGHQAMIGRLREVADRTGAPAVVLTFDPHPIALLAPDRLPPSLSTLARKAELLGLAGADSLVAVRTTRDLLNLSAAEFFDRVLRRSLAARGMVEGPDFRFGRDRGGDVSSLRAMCREAGMSMTVMDPVMWAGQTVSSSRIRRAIAAGEIAEAVDLLGHPYQVRGTVVRGEARGREIGFPTANVAGIPTLLPPDGVYAGVASRGGRDWPVAMNVGGNPTFGVSERKVEAHLVGYEGDLYGCDLAVGLLRRIRGTVAFADSAELTSRIERDVADSVDAAALYLETGASPGL